VIQASADIVVGADGMRSAVGKAVSAPVLRRGQHAAAVVYGYWPDLPIEGSEWYWSAGVAAGAIPTNGGETCVFVAVPADRFVETFQHDLRGGYHRLLTQAAPGLAAEIGWSQAAPRLHGFAGQGGYLRHSWGPGWALVGDAGYFKDPITAHGITDALRDAELLAQAITAGSPDALADYQRLRDDLSVGLFEATDAIASFDWSLDTLRELHERLSDEMSREADLIPEICRLSASSRSPSGVLA
jgi:flavin-dependent dehydrogenase